MALLDDETLMAQVQSGRVEMLALLFERHHVKLYNFFLRLTQDRSLSEDLVQETFLRILKYCDSYRREARFTTWMYQVAGNLHLDHLRKRMPLVSLEDVHEARLAKAADQGSDMAAQEEQDLLKRAMTMLAPRHREVILLSRFHGMKYAHIADIIGCSVPSVKVMVHRSVAELRRICTELSGGPT
ncbi:MAG: sigma-70 family RNA polymerase sigma factor [Acidobacteriota bacterium]